MSTEPKLVEEGFRMIIVKSLKLQGLRGPWEAERNRGRLRMIMEPKLLAEEGLG